jgi:hypothetical protein
MKVRISAPNGVLEKGRDELAKAIKQLKGDYIVAFISLSDPTSVEDWRKLYFHLRDLLWEHADTGYTKDELHDAIKARIIPEMWLEQEQWFTARPADHSTKHLTSAGWKQYVDRFKQFAQNEFEVYI